MGDAQDPAAGATGPPVTGPPDGEPDVAPEEDEDADPPDDVEFDAEPAGVDADEGAVGSSNWVLFENWQPASSTAAAVVTAQTQIFFIMSVYTFVCAHTVLVHAVSSNPGRSGKTTDATATVQESCQGSRDAYADMDPPGNPASVTWIGVRFGDVTAFLLRRLLYLLLLVVVSTSVAYVLAATQLNPRSRYEGRNPPPPPEVVDSALDAVNMNDKVPVLRRFGRWAEGVMHGDLGQTIENQPVNDELGRRMWVSLRLVLIGSFVGTLLGVVAGAYGAVKQYRLSDYALTIFSFVVLSIPIVVLAVLFKNAKRTHLD